MKEFAAGTKINVVAGEELEVVCKLGEGGQGTVYKVNYEGRELALKWYNISKISDPDRFYRNLQKNIKMGAPTENFLWPLEITEYYEDSFGYLMELRPPQYKDFSDFILTKVRFSSIEAMANAAINISNAFGELHSMGCSYQDLNDGNFFVNPDTGDVLICDNDNVAEYGQNLGIGGKSRYMAPEVVTGKKMPDVHTDRFSLAVVLYRLFFIDHPLEGKRFLKAPCLTEKYEQQFYGSEPIFVWDPTNDRNRPDPQVHVNSINLWEPYPDFVKETFIEALSYAAMLGNDTEHRVTEKKWQEVFINLRDCIVKCSSCGDETFIDTASPSTKCINCGCDVKRPFVLKVKRYNVALETGKKLYSCHVQNSSNDFREVKGEVVTSVTAPEITGIRNHTDRTWTAVNNSRQYANGQVVKLGVGLKIDFGGGLEGDII